MIRFWLLFFIFASNQNNLSVYNILLCKFNVFRQIKIFRYSKINIFLIYFFNHFLGISIEELDTFTGGIVPVGLNPAKKFEFPLWDCCWFIPPNNVFCGCPKRLCCWLFPNHPDWAPDWAGNAPGIPAFYVWFWPNSGIFWDWFCPNRDVFWFWLEDWLNKLLLCWFPVKLPNDFKLAPLNDAANPRFPGNATPVGLKAVFWFCCIWDDYWLINLFCTPNPEVIFCCEMASPACKSKSPPVFILPKIFAEGWEGYVFYTFLILLCAI